VWDHGGKIHERVVLLCNKKANKFLETVAFFERYLLWYFIATLDQSDLNNFPGGKEIVTSRERESATRSDELFELRHKSDI